MRCLAASFALLLLVQLTAAHSWVECLDTNRSTVYDRAREYIYGGKDAAGICAGYGYNYPGRDQSNKDDAPLLIKILRQDFPQPNTPVCRPEPPQYSGQGFGKRVQAQDGQTVFFRYMPNGHVAKDESARGTWYGVYWTHTPGTKLQFSSDLTPDKLVDGIRHDFDDQNCGQTYTDKTDSVLSGRAGDDFPCIGSFAIPTGTSPGIYSFVWGWKHWDETRDSEIVNAKGTFGGAYYGSCFDIEVVARDGYNVDSATGPGFVSAAETWPSAAGPSWP